VVCGFTDPRRLQHLREGLKRGQHPRIAGACLGFPTSSSAIHLVLCIRSRHLEVVTRLVGSLMVVCQVCGARPGAALPHKYGWKGMRMNGVFSQTFVVPKTYSKRA